MEEGLPTLLLRFSHDTIDIVKNIKESKEIKKVRRVWIRTRVTDFKYQEGSTLYGLSTEYIEKEEWDLKDKIQTILPEVKKLPSYMEVRKRISDTYGVTEPRAEDLLERFYFHVINDVLNENFSEEVLFENITIFLSDLEQSPITWEILAEIEGVWLKDEEIELTKGIKLRRPRPSDFEFERPMESMLSLLPEATFRLPSAIMEIKLRAKTQPSMWDELEK